MQIKVPTVAKLPGGPCLLHVRNSRKDPPCTVDTLKNQWLVEVEGGLHPHMLDSVLPFVTKLIKAEAVLLWIDQRNQLLPQVNVLLIVDGTLKYRILNSLTKVETLLRHIPQSALPCLVSCRDIIGDKNHHGPVLATSMQTADTRPSHRGESGPSVEPESKGQAPVSSSPPEMDA